jgi:putative membrane-bound dehydrogenase-like protein
MPRAVAHLLLSVGVPVAILAVGPAAGWIDRAQTPAGAPSSLVIRPDEAAHTIAVFRQGARQPLVTQHAPPDGRPYLHPIAAPDGTGVLTEVSPAHHPHQTGVYWGLTRVNGRDYFHNRDGNYWRRVSAAVTRGGAEAADEVRWQTVYDLIDESGRAVLTTTERWSVREIGGRLLADLEWRAEARIDVTIGQYDYGGLFVRMPWRDGVRAEVVNAARQRNARADGQRAMWIDIGIELDARSDPAHVAIFDHPDNTGYPQPWRVDEQFGVGSARSRTGDFRLPAGATEILRHQLVVYTGTLDDVRMTAAWTEWSGNRSVYSTAALWGIAQREGRDAPFLSPDEAVNAMTVVDGYAVNTWAAEPAIGQPMAFAWDDRGRLWVAENHDYETRGRGFSNHGRSRILILEDTNRDGAADSRKVFMEGIVFPSALAVGFGGVFVGAPPNLLFIPDRDGDDRADVEDIEVRLTGWGIQDRHEVLNSFHWGPDGWLYGLQGYATTSKVRKPAGGGRLFKPGEPFPDDLLQAEGVDINGGVWRYHPTKDRFEVVAHGFSNPWGIDYDAKGQMLITACVIPHLFHVVPGGVYHRQGGQHFNPYVYSDIQTIADHRHRSAHGGARVYQSDAFPEAERGRVFMANIHEHAVLSDVLSPNGSGFTARHGEDVLLANNAQWIGFSLEIGPDGALYVLDWHDGDICGNDVLHRDTGRIYRISARETRAAFWDGRYGDLARLPDAELVDLQASRSDWHARRARVILQHRASNGPLAPATYDALRGLFIGARDPDVRLRAMWALHVTNGWTPESLRRALGDRDEYVRAWAVQLLSEDGSLPAGVLADFARLARSDRSAVVRLYLASALQRIDPGARWAIAAPLLARAPDAADPNLPTMIWLAVEPLVTMNPALALDHASRSRIPQIARFIARRAVDADLVEPLVAVLARRPATVRSLVQGLREGLEGRFDLAAPPNWPVALDRLRRADRDTARLANDVAERFQTTESARLHLAALGDRAAPTDRRRLALQTLAAGRRPDLVAGLPALFDEAPLRLDAIRAAAAFDEEALGALMLARYASLTSVEQAAAIQTMSSRPRYGRMLTEALANGTVPRADVPPHIARQLRRIVGVKFAEVWGPVEPNVVEDRTLSRYRLLLTERAVAAADVRHGRALFERTCASCHVLYGEGGTIGPDLTGSNRANLDYLLFNVLNPDGDVPEAYRLVVVTSRDGRTYSGTVVAETDRLLTLRVVGQDAVVLNKADIQSREATAASMMPAGLFERLTDREVIDLVAYLRVVEPIAEPVAGRPGVVR